MRDFVCAANWKMNKSPEEAADFMRDFTANWSDLGSKEVIIFPSALCWREVRDGIRDLPILWGLQNGYPKDSGAFTGEISMKMMADLGAQTVLVGHSERRTYFSESDDFLAEKMKAAQAHSLHPMLCVGETLSERESNSTESVILGQLKNALAKTDFKKKIYVAYEPVWAIGTGKVATPEMAQAAHKTLRKGLDSIAGEEVSARTQILYGGSVKPDNALELSQQEDIDGFLIGGAALEVESFKKIIEIS